jgi:hypothetical protein
MLLSRVVSFIFLTLYITSQLPGTKKNREILKKTKKEKGLRFTIKCIEHLPFNTLLYCILVVLP